MSLSLQAVWDKRKDAQLVLNRISAFPFLGPVALALLVVGIISMVSLAWSSSENVASLLVLPLFPLVTAIAGLGVRQQRFNLMSCMVLMVSFIPTIMSFGTVYALLATLRIG